MTDLLWWAKAFGPNDQVYDRIRTLKPNLSHAIIASRVLFEVLRSLPMVDMNHMILVKLSIEREKERERPKTGSPGE